MAKNFYITTPIYYPSGNPHMGHAYSSIIADIFARFKRLEKYNVLFLSGTDEHGQKNQKEAYKMKKNPKLFCDEISETFRSLTKKLNLTNAVILATAHPCKFPAAIEKAISKSEKLPESLNYIYDKEEKFQVISNDLEKVKDFVRKYV